MKALWLSLFIVSVQVLTSSGAADAWMGAMYNDRPVAYLPLRPVPRGSGMWYQQRRSAMDDVVEENGQDPLPSCLGDPCRNDNGCCDSMMCKLPEPEDLVRTPPFPVQRMGICVPNPHEGLPCKSSDTCGHGLECAMTIGSRGYKTCQPFNRDASRKQLNDECTHSLECDQSRNLCCQMQRRHRQSPRQICSYYKDASECVGFSRDPGAKSAFGLKTRWWQY